MSDQAGGEPWAVIAPQIHKSYLHDSRDHAIARGHALARMLGADMVVDDDLKIVRLNAKSEGT